MVLYQPKQRIVPVDILSIRGWISAKVHVGEVNFFLDAINTIPYFLRLSEVRMEKGNRLDFLGLQRHGTQIIIPRESGDMVARVNPAEKVVKRVVCFLQREQIEGDLRLLPDIRVSDYLAKCSSYFALYNTSGNVWREQKGEGPDRFAGGPAALVNSEAIMGITER